MGITSDVNEQVAQDAVDKPRGDRGPWCGNLLEGDLQLVEMVIASLINAWGLAGRADKHAGEEIRQPGMVLPISDQAAQQIRTAQERAIHRRRRAQGNMVAAASASVAAILHKLFGAQPRKVGLVIELDRVVNQLLPTMRRVDVDLDHAGIRGNQDLL